MFFSTFLFVILCIIRKIRTSFSNVFCSFSPEPFCPFLSGQLAVFSRGKRFMLGVHLMTWGALSIWLVSCGKLRGCSHFCRLDRSENLNSPQQLGKRFYGFCGWKIKRDQRSRWCMIHWCLIFVNIDTPKFSAKFEADIFWNVILIHCQMLPELLRPCWKGLLPSGFRDFKDGFHV